MCGETIVDLSMCAESVYCVTEDALSLCFVGAYVNEYGCSEFQYAVHECDWSIVLGSVLFGLYINFVALTHKFLGV